MNRIPEPWSRCIWPSRSITWACNVTSRAVVGSSAISSAGSPMVAMAIIARWRMPPLSSWG